MNYMEIKNYDIANGPGVRVSLFVSGCTHHCEGCFNPESWDFKAGRPGCCRLYLSERKGWIWDRSERSILCSDVERPRKI